MHSTIEIYRDGRWQAAAGFEPVGKAPYAVKFRYDSDYACSANPHPVSLTLPVSPLNASASGDGLAPLCPPFLLDLVPQGPGRKHLLGELGRSDGEGLDLVLAQCGAANPIGNLRLDTAVQFARRQAEKSPSDREDGFLLEEIFAHPERFIDHLRRHAAFSAGTTAVQGAAPKFLLAQNIHGRWFADAALPDEEAAAHWLLKLARSSHEVDGIILRSEAAYLRVAERSGIRMESTPQLRNNMLFTRRFDRRVDQKGVHRLHQESLAALAGLSTFGQPVSLFELTAALARYASDPPAEVAEFIKRDILNMALRNTDNHPRNSAVQRLPNGTVQLTPLYDFAPMYLDRHQLPRNCTWRLGKTVELTDWEQIFEALSVSNPMKREIAEEVAEFAPAVARLPQVMQECEVAAWIIEDCKPSIESQLRRLQALRPRSRRP